MTLMKRKSARVPNFRMTLFLCILCGLMTAATLRAENEQKFAHLGDFKLESGEVIHDCQIGYRIRGTLNEDKSNAILFPTWFSGRSAELAEYVGLGKMIDPERYYVVQIDALGNGVSSSPSNSTAQAKDKFPQITIRDMVHAEYLVATKELELKHVRAVIGASMGGMQTFQWAVSYPEFMDVAIPITGTPQQTSYDLLLWNTEARSIEEHLRRGDEDDALNEAALIDRLNLTTPQDVVTQTKRGEFDKFVAETIAEAKGESNPYDYLWQLRAMIAQDISPRGGTLEDAAKIIRAKILIIVARQDHMVNPIPALRFAQLLHARTLVLDSDCGHLTTGCKGAELAAAVQSFLSERQG